MCFMGVREVLVLKFIIKMFEKFSLKNYRTIQHINKK